MLLRELARKGRGTNMHVEGLLAQLRSACPARCSTGSNAERFAYLGALVQLMAKHTSAGRADSRRVTFEQMRQAGVPLDIPRSQPHHARPPRVDSSFVCSGLAAFRRAHPTCTAEAQSQERRRLYKVWADMSPAERAQHAVASGPALLEVEGEVTPPGMENHFMPAAWDTGDNDWPVSECPCDFGMFNDSLVQDTFGPSPGKQCYPTGAPTAPPDPARPGPTRLRPTRHDPTRPDPGKRADPTRLRPSPPFCKACRCFCSRPSARKSHGRHEQPTCTSLPWPSMARAISRPSYPSPLGADVRARAKPARIALPGTRCACCKTRATPANATASRTRSKRSDGSPARTFMCATPASSARMLCTRSACHARRSITASAVPRSRQGKQIHTTTAWRLAFLRLA